MTLSPSSGLTRSPLRTNPAKVREFHERARRNTKPSRRPVSPASPAQRAKVADAVCLVCGRGPCHPAHLIDRSLCPVGADDPRAVVPLCAARCHRAYDDGTLSLLEHLEPSCRVELAFAVERSGLMATVRRVTNERSTE